MKIHQHNADQMTKMSAMHFIIYFPGTIGADFGEALYEALETLALY